MNSNAVRVKAFLRNEGNCEARRFFVEDPSVITNFEYMKGKLQLVYPILRDCVFRITWKDDDGDEITITSDEDLLTAVAEMPNYIKIYVTVLSKRSDDGDFHGDMRMFTSDSRVICDACNNLIRGFRYKCMDCPDYDLCAKCEQCELHSEHLMIRIPNSDMYQPRCARKLLHQFAKSMKKAHHIAGKEAHRAAKFAHKAQGKCWEKYQEASKPSTSGKEETTNNTKSKCPMEDHVNNLSNLGYMAMGPFMDILQPQPNTEGVTGGQLAEAVRKAFNTFLEGVAPQTPQPAAAASSSTTTTPTEIPTPENQNSQQNFQQNPQQNSTPMDVEHHREEAHNNASNIEKLDEDWAVINKNTEDKFANEDPKIKEGIKKLLEMGFNNEDHLYVLLKLYDGNVGAVVKSLLENEAQFK